MAPVASRSLTDRSPCRVGVGPPILARIIGGSMQFELTPAQRKLQAKARELARGQIAERAAEIDRTEQYPWDNIALLKEAGFFGMTIPAAYGGTGAGYLDAVLVIEEMAKCCGITGRIVVEANMGAIGAIMKYGSDAQKRF